MKASNQLTGVSTQKLKNGVTVVLDFVFFKLTAMHPNGHVENYQLNDWTPMGKISEIIKSLEK